MQSIFLPRRIERVSSLTAASETLLHFRSFPYFLFMQLFERELFERLSTPQQISNIIGLVAKQHENDNYMAYQHLRPVFFSKLNSQLGSTF